MEACSKSAAHATPIPSLVSVNYADELCRSHLPSWPVLLETGDVRSTTPLRLGESL